MNEDDLLRILAAIRIGQDIPGMNKGTVFRFVGLGRYDSHGRAREFDGWPIVTLDSQHRRRPPYPAIRQRPGSNSRRKIFNHLM